MTLITIYLAIVIAGILSAIIAVGHAAWECPWCGLLNAQEHGWCYRCGREPVVPMRRKGAA